MPNTDLDTALKQIRANLAGYDRYQAYADGSHNLAFATAKYSNAFGSLFREFADNLCGGVIDAVADRLVVTGFGVEGIEDKPAGTPTEAPVPTEKDAGALAWEIWQRNRMDQRSGEAHQHALKHGDCWVIVWPNAEGEPVIYINDARTMTGVYDDEEPGKLLWAAKAWVMTDKRKRLTLYYPDRIEKYITQRAGADMSLPESAKTFVPYTPEGESVWPLPNPYGKVPVFHLANNAGVGKFGVSELKHVIPLQDALNKTNSDMLVAMEFSAFKQRYATGIQIPIDPVTGQAVSPFNPAVDRFWATPDKDAKFGEFQAADLTNFLAVCDNYRFEIARVSATPLHFFMLMSDPPSGEALKTLEARFVKKVKDRQTAFGNSWEGVMALALEQAGNGTDIRLDTQWADAAPVSTQEAYTTADIALNKLNMDEEYIWATLLDIPDAEIAAMLKRREERKKAAMQEQRQTMQARAETFGVGPQGLQSGAQAQPATVTELAA